MADGGSSTGKKVGSIILVIIAYGFGIFGALILIPAFRDLLYKPGEDWSTDFIISLLIFCFCGFFSFGLIYGNMESKGDKALAVIAFIPALVLYIGAYIIFFIFDLIGYAASTDLFDGLCGFLARRFGFKLSVSGKYGSGGYSGGGSSYSSSDEEEAETYVVNYEGHDRTLTFCERKEDYMSEETPHPYYNRFKDDIGYYWRSYDNNQTFRRETYEETSRGY